MKHVIPAIILLAFTSLSEAKPPTDNAFQFVELDAQLSLKIPADFNAQMIAKTPPSFAAIGPSPDGTGNKRPAVLVFLSPPIGENGRAAFLARAKSVAEGNLAKFGLKITEIRDLELKDGINGSNMIAMNDAGQSWWAIRTIHLGSHSVMLIVTAFEKPMFDRLADYGKHVLLISK